MGTLTASTKDNEGVDNGFPSVCVSKSPNKHNRLYMWANPLGEELCKAIDDGDVFPTQDVKERARLLADKYDWDVNEARKIWTFGCPPDSLANMVVDTTRRRSHVRRAVRGVRIPSIAEP